jgi:excisionase family DNA binding protein
MDMLIPAQFSRTPEIAQLLKLQPRTGQRWVEAGQLKASVFGRKYRMRGADVHLFLETYKVKPPPHPVAHP